ncbi:M24 family metallopeptidase [Jiangella rhizosphaerae]|uniref:Aminopeptidase P family protein n=1 Tax=Jiangella rhizosphaerae TaxID=2293569 RepID=A0A418KLS7_9ACTN|nr:Xaa-Pro peptidase family protein [Jiangella rhizosphaerae]RIQ18892.1 aminopeptidase P family protein [Jiangella rhizosphaerae]
MTAGSTQFTVPPRPAVDTVALARDRLDRLRAGLAEQPYDAVVLTEPESVLYATGYRSMPGQVFRTHRMAALVTATDLWLVAPAADVPAGATVLPVDRISPFGRFYVESGTPDPVTEVADRHDGLAAALAAVVATLPPTARLAVETRDVPADVLAACGDVVEDGAGLLFAVRSRKLPAEVELLGYAARLAEAGIDAALAAAGPGTTEAELAAVVAGTMVAGGGDPRFVVALTGERSALADAVPSDRAWRPGEIARFDVGCVVDGYWSDIGRTAVLGEPSARQRDVYAAVKAGEDEQLAAARPGLPASELFEIGLDAVARGVPRYRRQHCGHGIGLSIYEPPIVAPGADTELAAGMTFCFETPYYELGWGGMMVEDAVVVTAGGVEVLTRSSRDLRVVPA